MPNLTDDGRVTIIIAEDDDGHAELIHDLLREVGVRNPIVRFKDGRDAMDYLNARFDRRAGTLLLLLDIRMPRMDGIEVLRAMKSDPQLKSIPVVMLTTSDDPKEVQGCYELGCNCYVTKPVDFASFTAVLRQLGLFLLIIEVPKVPAVN